MEKQKKKKPASVSQEPLNPGVKAVAADSLISMVGSEVKLQSQIVVGDCISHPNCKGKGKTVSRIEKFFVDASELVHLRYGSPSGVRTDPYGNKYSDFFRNVAIITENTRLLVSRQRTLKSSFNVEWKPAEEIVAPFRDVKEIFDALPPGLSKEIRKEIRSRLMKDRRFYAFLVDGSYCLSESEAERALERKVRMAWKEAGCGAFPFNPVKLRELLIDVCKFLGIWLGDGENGSSGVVVSKEDLPSLVEFLKRFVKVLGDDFEVHMTPKRALNYEDSYLVSSFFSCRSGGGILPFLETPFNS
jgi:hypothetical protein